MNDNANIDPADQSASDSSAPSAGAAAPAADGDRQSALQRERDELYDRLLRKSAEFDNFRKRVDRERQELVAWAAADVLGELVAIVDDFERALQADAPPEAQPYRAGVELIHRQMADLLKKRGVTAIDALGVDFDPHVHQAVAYDETPGAREGEVVAVLRKGYMLGERLLRPAMVRVAKAS
ncbi:MAG: nucleotide exchange factor GrpE [Acidobacteriota bacterium]